MTSSTLLFTLLLGISSQAFCGAFTPGEALIKWVRRCGGIVDLEISTVDDKGLRGVIAARDMNRSQIAIHLPAHLAVELGEGHVTPEENAVSLFRLQKQNPAWNRSMEPYWDSLPPVGASLTKQTYPAERLDLLQNRILAASIIVHSAYTKNVYEGGKPALVEDFLAEFPGVSYGKYSHMTSVVASYAFLFPNEQGVAKRMLLPLLDMVNHADGRDANMEIMQADSGDFYAYTLRDIAKGEELVHQYNTGIQRNDQSLFHYGFIRNFDPPMLVAQDLPAGNLYDATSYSEEDYEFGGRLVTKEELVRLETILQSFPTTEAEDAQLLEGKSGGWGSLFGRSEPLRSPLERMFVQYRMLRKRALAHVIQRLKDALIITKEL